MGRLSACLARRRDSRALLSPTATLNSCSLSDSSTSRRIHCSACKLYPTVSWRRRVFFKLKSTVQLPKPDVNCSMMPRADAMCVRSTISIRFLCNLNLKCLNRLRNYRYTLFYYQFPPLFLNRHDFGIGVVYMTDIRNIGIFRTI